MPETETAAAAPDPWLELNLPPLILGSGSFTRKLILTEMRIPYQILTRPIDETSIGDRSINGDASKLVLELGVAKADHLVDGIRTGANYVDFARVAREEVPDANTNEEMIANDGRGWLILTADQVVTQTQPNPQATIDSENGTRILEKPSSVAQAKQFVSSYAVHAPRTVGSCVLTHIPSLIRVSGVDTARINFKPTIHGDLVDKLINDGAPVLAYAGGLMVEHPFVKEYIEGIDGTEDSVMGLSKDLVWRLLTEMKSKLAELE